VNGLNFTLLQHNIEQYKGIHKRGSKSKQNNFSKFCDQTI
jgi:hypothetical protein